MPEANSFRHFYLVLKGKLILSQTLCHFRLLRGFRRKLFFQLFLLDFLRRFLNLKIFASRCFAVYKNINPVHSRRPQPVRFARKFHAVLVAVGFIADRNDFCFRLYARDFDGDEIHLNGYGFGRIQLHQTVNRNVSRTENFGFFTGFAVSVVSRQQNFFDRDFLNFLYLRETARREKNTAQQYKDNFHKAFGKNRKFLNVPSLLVRQLSF